MVMNRPSITAERFCGISLQSSGCTTTDTESHWKIDLSQYSVVPEFIPPKAPRQGKLEGGGEKDSANDVSTLVEGITPRRRNYQTFDSKIPVGI